MSFTEHQRKELAKPLDPRNVKPPAPGKYGDYIEGWKVIEEANRIFGFDGWSRETVENVEVCRYETSIGRDNKPGWAVGYRAKVRVTVHTEGGVIVREGTAAGNGVSVQLYDAIESAAKEAETDAMKRAMMTFGYPFGLALYDKSKANVQPPAVELITDKQRDEIAIMAQGAGVELASICKAAKVASLKELPAAKFENIINRLKATMQANAEKQKEAA